MATIDQAIEDCLQGARLTDEQAARIEAKFREWLEQEQAASPMPEFPMKLSAIHEKLDKLTDALVDRLIDQDTFKERKHNLLLEEARLKEQMLEFEKTVQNPEGFTEFLELVKSLVYTYQIAAPPEKQSIAKMATSNRTVKGRNIYIEPSKWLLDLQLVADVRCGGPHRGTDRTFISFKSWHNELRKIDSSPN